MSQFKVVDYETIQKAMQSVAFIDEVEVFNIAMGKPEANNYEPTLSTKEHQEFVYNFILEELEEYKEACEQEDIIGIADALGDIMYVLCNGILVHGLKNKFNDIYQEIQRSNMSKICETEEIANQTVNYILNTKGIDCYHEKVDNHWVVYRSTDKKVQKSIKYSKPNLKQFLNQ